MHNSFKESEKNKDPDLNKEEELYCINCGHDTGMKIRKYVYRFKNEDLWDKLDFQMRTLFKSGPVELVFSDKGIHIGKEIKIKTKDN